MKNVYENPDIQILYFEYQDIVTGSLNDVDIDNNISGSDGFGDIVRPSTSN